MNRSIRFTAIFSLLLTVVLLANLTVVHAFRKDEYADNPLNRRGYLTMQEIPRGQISAGGETLARSEADADGIYHRVYGPDPAAFGHITGYLSEIYGASGVEAAYNRTLNGTGLGTRSLITHLVKNEDGGDNVELTIIPEVQRTAYRRLADAGYEGSVVALRPSTGEILAMASTPGFDPSTISDPATAESAWEELTTREDDPLLNHAAQETLPPGSTFKIITTAAGLANGYSPNSRLTGEPAITLPGTTQQLTNYGGQPCAGGGEVTLTTAFEHSCNTAFVQMGIDVGADELRRAAEAFGVGEKYDIGLPVSAGALGDLPGDAEVGQSSIGQRDVAMSALQAAVMAGTIANGGVRMSPHLVSRITAPDLSVVRTVGAKTLNRAVSPEIAGQITELMRASERHTAGATGQDIASKTGTAEHGAPGTPPHTWYVAFAPTADADVAVAVVVKDGGGQGQGATGGQVASPVGRAVLNAALEARR